jgi:hypothetical protein
MPSRDNNFTKEQIKGLSLTVKGMSKKYKFVKNWEFSHDFEQYNSILYLNIYIDVDILSEFVGIEVDDYYRDRILKHPDYAEYHRLFGPLKYDYQNKEIAEKSSQMKEDMITYMNNTYSMFPENLRIQYNVFSDTMVDVKLGIDIFKPMEIFNQ